MHEEASAECWWKETGEPPVAAIWVVVIKNSKGDVFIRGRCVARVFRQTGGEREDLFAPTSPSYMLKSHLALSFRLMGPPRDGPGEKDKSPGKCWKHETWLHGMRPAARAWEEDNADKLSMLNMVRSKAAPTCF